MSHKSNAASADTIIRPVHKRSDFNAMFALARSVNRHDPAWISQLDFERHRQWSKRSPWFEHAEAQAWIAYRNGRPAGSVSAQIDTLHLEKHADGCGYFGSFECEDDAVAAPLLDAAAAWLAERGMSRMRGPFDLGINQACGLLVDGFETPPMVMMPHHPPRYRTAIEQAGCRKAMELRAYIVPPNFEAPAAMQRILRAAAKRIRVRPLNRRFAGEMEVLRDIFNDAWANNWGFVPLTRKEFEHMGADLKQLIRPEYVQIAEVDGEPAAFIVALPDINELIRDLDGRLLPFGWAKLLWRIKRRSATGARVPLMGVRQQYQRGRLGTALAFAVIDAVRWPLHSDGVREVELSWILETNTGMCSIIEAIGGRCYKRYWIYEREL